jgi:hypothetical protein
VEHRQEHREAIEADGFQHLPAALDVVQQIAVGKHGALRATGGAGSVNDDGEILFGLRVRAGEWIGAATE